MVSNLNEILQLLAARVQINWKMKHVFVEEIQNEKRQPARTSSSMPTIHARNFIVCARKIFIESRILMRIAHHKHEFMLFFRRSDTPSEFSKLHQMWWINFSLTAIDHMSILMCLHFRKNLQEVRTTSFALQLSLPVPSALDWLVTWQILNYLPQLHIYQWNFMNASATIVHQSGKKVKELIGDQCPIRRTERPTRKNQRNDATIKLITSIYFCRRLWCGGDTRISNGFLCWQ